MEEETLKTLLDERFSKLDETLEERFSKIDERFSKTDGRFSQLENRMDTRFANMQQQMDAGFLRVGVELEQLNHSMQQNNELIHGVDEKLEGFRAEAKYDFKTTRGLIGTSNAGLVKRIDELAKTRS